MAQQLKTLALLLEDPSLVHSTHVGQLQLFAISDLENLIPASTLVGAYVHVAYTQTQT